MKKYLTYEEFGAIGDGVHDDFDAIIACHNKANEMGIPVKANDNAEYYIGGADKSAIVKTDVDFGNAKFIIDDRSVERIQSYIFIIESDFLPFSPEIESLKKGQTRLDLPHDGNLYVRVFNDENKVYIRKGLNMNNGTATTDCFILDEDGNISPSVDFEYEKITRTYAIRTDDAPITLRGGRFVTIANQAASFYTYYKRGFLIKRSHVTVTDVYHTVEGELDHGAPYHGFYYVAECTDVKIENALLTPRFIYYTASKIEGKDVMMGSYDLSFYAAIGVHCKNVTQTIDILDKRYWGIYTSNFCKNLSLENCKISRFDAHQGVTNVSIRNCEIGHQQIKLIGFGEAVIENTVVHSSSWCFIELRGDYGSIWDGNVTIKNCTWQPSRSNASLISASNSQDHDYGYKCMMPHTITIDGLYIEDGSFTESELGKLTIFNSFDNAPAEGKPYPYEPTEKLVLKNVRTESKYDYSISQNPVLFEKLVVEK